MTSEGHNRITKFAPARLATPSDYESVVVESPKPPTDTATKHHVQESMAAKKTYELQQKINATKGNMPRYAEVSDNGSVGHTARLQLEVEKKRLNTHN